MSFLTEYFDNYRQHPFRKTKICRPEERYAPLQGQWLEPSTGSDDKQWSEDDVNKFIKKTMANLRGRSTYFNHFCAHFPEDMGHRPFVPRPKKKKACPNKEAGAAPAQAERPLEPIDVKGTELMLSAQALYERDLDHLVLSPLGTHHRILGYARPRLYGCGASEYAETVARLGYALMRDGLTRPCQLSNGARPRWGLPPERARQPPLDVAPYDGESLY